MCAIRLSDVFFHSVLGQFSILGLVLGSRSHTAKSGIFAVLHCIRTHLDFGSSKSRALCNHYFLETSMSPENQLLEDLFSS